MSKRNWKIIYSNYSGVEKKAIELVSKEVGAVILRDAKVYSIHVLPLEKNGTAAGKNIIAIGRPSENEIVAKYVNDSEIPQNGYLVKVIDNPEDENLQIVIITGREPVSVFYAAVDFVDNYLPQAARLLSNWVKSDYNTFDGKIPSYCHCSAPKTAKRSIFTWGQPINDYRNYIDNAARCRINQLIIWNDFLPLNAADIVSYAHEYEMELIWGFAWGWTSNMCSDTDFSKLDEMKADILDNFKNNYNGAGDGIYFQSFTETADEQRGDVVIAQTVVKFVNEIAAEIYKINPDMHIQFGLHATSVKNKLEYIEAVDKRIEIIWEDCGSFPYSYIPQIESKEDFSETIDFTKKIVGLRNGGKTGLVYKGLMTLDWKHFAHQSGTFLLGTASEQLIADDIAMLSPIWRKFTSDWLTSGKYVYEFTKELHKFGSENINLNIAAQLAGKIWFPYALLTEILWSTEDSYEEILARVLRKKCVTMP